MAVPGLPTVESWGNIVAPMRRGGEAGMMAGANSEEDQR